IYFQRIENKKSSLLFPWRKLIAYCMRKREPSESLNEIYFIMLLFQFCLHTFCLFLGLAIKKKIKNESYPSITIFVIQVLEISESMSV
uniref:Uncharacterized protein n=1 Tax=Bos indicus x Bos taurus TaxID=30522 RepID=A0A4W2GD89_BOBOX